MSYRPPAPLGPAHDTDGFVCGSPEQTDWLVRHARESMAISSTRVLVVTPADSNQVVAFYAWTMVQTGLVDVPARRRKGAGPADSRCTSGRRDALDNVAEKPCSQPFAFPRQPISWLIVPEFEASPTDELHLVLLLRDIRRTLHAGGEPTSTTRGERDPRL